MIKIIASGGLGNQLYYWNLAHALHNHYQCKIKIIFPVKNLTRNNELIHLVSFCNHEIKVTSSNLINHLFRGLDKILRIFPLIHEIIVCLGRIHHSKLPSEPFKLPRYKPNFIRGYFQSPTYVLQNLNLYFNEIDNYTNKILHESVYKSVDFNNTQFLHIRRGDHLENKDTVGLLKYEFFINNLEVSDKIIICTDSEENIQDMSSKFPTATILGPKESNSWLSFAILSNSKKLVLSNSTFSWWAGLIAQKRGGSIISPEPWTLSNVYGDDYMKPNIFKGVTSIFEGKQ